MGDPQHEMSAGGNVTAALTFAAIGAGIALVIRAFREDRDYDPVAEAQRVARRALGIED